MAPNSLGLMVLFLWFLRVVANATEVIGIIGGSVEMACLYSGEEPFILDKFRVLWQKENSLVSMCPIHAYSPGVMQCEEFKNRTVLNEQLKKGNFSLRLLDIRPTDEFTYECVIQRNHEGYVRVFQKSSVTLKVAAPYSTPVIRYSGQPGEEMILTCNSSHGYPFQNLKWINQTDDSLLNATEWHTKASNGTFSVSSTLMIKTNSDTNLGCRIENQRLHQNITTTFDKDSVMTSPHVSDSNHGTHIALGVLPAVILFIILYICWNKRRSFQRTYTDVCENEEAAHCNAPVEIETFQSS